MTAHRLKCSTAEYLADPAPEPSLSSSTAKLLNERSTAHAWLVHPRLGGQRSDSTAEQDMGTIVHRIVLERGAEIQRIEAKDWRTAAAREARDAARADGRIPVLTKQLGEATAAAMAITVALADAGVRLDGDCEVPILWQEQAAHGAIWCRSMLDHVIAHDGRLVIYDLKTTHNAHPVACMRSALSFGYDIQQEAYTRAAEALWPEYAGRVDFVFLFAEPQPPYVVTPARLDGIMRERGRRRWELAVNLWSRCLNSDTWPAYTNGIVTLESPAWILQSETEAAMASEG